MTINYKSWEQQMHDKYGDMYKYYYENAHTTLGNSGPSFSSQFECDEWSRYVQARKSGTIKCPYCGK